MATALLLAACTLASACTSTDSRTDEAPKKTPTAVAKPSSQAPADPTETAKAEAVETYRQYWQAMERLYADPSGKDTSVKQYAAAAALLNAEKDAKSAHSRKLIHTGEVSVLNPTVTSYDIDRKIPNVAISSCLDISRWQVVHAESKEPAALPTTRLTKYVIVSTVERWPEGWRVIRDEPQGKQC
ncbi:hypothetical protein ABT282_34095 [Streptomyces sp. NPDC000927]|uniref:hypothetical protein n=1 Tax=Streptomyces sp. NPDC000927 TaxID=3154371 RepID=UPI00331A72EF